MEYKINSAAPLRITENRHDAVNAYLKKANIKRSKFFNFGEFFDYILKAATDNLDVKKPVAAIEETRVSEEPTFQPSPYDTGIQAVDEHRRYLDQLIIKLTTDNEKLSTENEQLTEERNQAIQRSMEIYNAPFAQLDEASFRTVIDITDNKIMPLLRQLTDTPFLELTPRQKFLLIWNYAVNDPIQHIFKHIPGIPDDAKQKLEDLQFPRAVDMEAIYGEFTATVKHILAKVEAAEKQQIPLEKVLDAFEAKIYNGYTAYYNNEPATNDATQLIQEETEDTGHHGEGAE